MEDKSVLEHVKSLLSFLKRCHIRFRFLAVSVGLSFGLSSLTVYSVSLLFPLIQGIIKGNFNNVRTLAGMKFFINHFPMLFGNSTRLFVFLVIWVYITIIIKNAFHYGAFLTSDYQARTATVKLRELLLEKCFSFGKQFYDKNTVSYLQGVLTKSTDIIDSQFSLLQEMIIQMLLLVSYLYVMIKISWKLTLVSIVIFPLIHICMRKITTKVKQAALAYSQASVNLNEKVANILFCMPVIRSFVKEKDEMNEFLEISRQEIDQSFKMQKLTHLINPLQDLGSTTGMLLVAIVMAFLVKVDASITASSALVFFYLALKLLPSLTSISDFKIGMASAIGSIRDIDKILNNSDTFQVSSGSTAFTGLERNIRCKDLTFSYGGKNAPVLNKLNLKIEKGKVTAIVGPTGSGKSTLIHLLMRFYDCPTDSILIDGKDIKEFDISSFRSRLAYISQDALLFNASLKSNILYADQTTSEEMQKDMLESIARQAMITETVSRMPDQFETKIGDKGGRLSGGEKQRIAIARALVKITKGADIIIMDEATSALDSETEQAITESLEKQTKGKTVIMIAHRLSTIKKADKIVYLKDGSIIESGTLEELLENKRAFYRQWTIQKI